MKTKYLIKKILRKIYHFIGFISIFMICLLPVKADIDTTVYVFPIINGLNDTPNSNTIDYIYDTLIPNYSSYDYLVSLPYTNNTLLVVFSNSSSNISFSTTIINGIPITTYSVSDVYLCEVPNSSTPNSSCSFVTNGVTSFIQLIYSDSSNNIHYNYYDSSSSLISSYNFEMSNFYSDNIIVNIDSSYPKLKDLYNYSSFSDYESSNNYISVNLDNYDYVLLSLKNYNQSSAFQSNLQVKGQIGITPIYNYGQTSKDSVTGVQVQDRCNASYSDFTSYPLYILQSDLQNNVVYAVKKCSSPTSFKFDSNIFDITYVTQDNVSDPIVTINGQQYHTIPYNDLPSTATKNESDNYIPGESYNFVDSGIDSLNSALKQSSNWLSTIWSTITYFTQFIGLIFASLPSELHAILISAFTITIIIGLIKHFTS